MSNLHEQRCYNHAGREAVAGCPECGHFYCRECITEHAERIICAECLGRITASEVQHPSWATGLYRATALLGAILVVWAILYFAGLGLAAIPTEFHEGAYADASYVSDEGFDDASAED